MHFKTETIELDKENNCCGIVYKDVTATTQESNSLRHGKWLGDRHNTRSRKKADYSIRNELGQDVPDRGQEHFAHSDDGFPDEENLLFQPLAMLLKLGQCGRDIGKK